ncbi:OTU deubiquitinase with linear linkage specificity a isoform X1 [Denticeps clupeoides]|uniref:Essential protein Yae1 N-terminal domain-containing protein n=1 Tax=Denticeps clupeoides TaxID=299321 RepID=A0AAY4BS26_9TELE|nr:protein YAE1 homolog isoform X1 [Denticeps clupeoides]
MSWVKALGSSEDVFDENADDISLQSKEWKYNMEKRAKDGFRDGINAGKEASLQAGFNQGYRAGALRMKAVGQLKGTASALQIWCQLQDPGSPAAASVSSLLQCVVQHEERIEAAMKRAQERPIPSVGDVSEDLANLGVGLTPEQGCGRTDCCKEDTDCSSSHSSCSTLLHSHPAGQSLEELLRWCMSIVVELGLPEGLLHHLQQISTSGLRPGGTGCPSASEITVD